MVGGAAFTDAAASLIAQLKQTERLVWGHSPGLTDAGLEQLIGLGLGELYVYNCGLSEAVCPGESGALLLEWAEEQVSTAC
jgi:hypothetical protein